MQEKRKNTKEKRRKEKKNGRNMKGEYSEEELRTERGFRRKEVS